MVVLCIVWNRLETPADDNKLQCTVVGYDHLYISARGFGVGKFEQLRNYCGSIMFVNVFLFFCTVFCTYVLLIRLTNIKAITKRVVWKNQYISIRFLLIINAL